MGVEDWAKAKMAGVATKTVRVRRDIYMRGLGTLKDCLVGADSTMIISIHYIHI